MKKYLLATILICAPQSTLPMRAGPGPYLMAIANSKIAEIRDQFIHAAQSGDLAGVKVRFRDSWFLDYNFRDLPEIALAESAKAGHTEICEFLLERGTKTDRKNLLWYACGQSIPTILCNYLLAPHPKTIPASRKIIITFLACMNKYTPIVPRDIRLVILGHMQDMGTLMIGRAIAGKEITAQYLDIARARLLEITMGPLINTENAHLQAMVEQFKQGELATKLSESISQRLLSKPFKCNETEPDPSPNEGSCIIS